MLHTVIFVSTTAISSITTVLEAIYTLPKTVKYSNSIKCIAVYE